MYIRFDQEYLLRKIMREQGVDSDVEVNPPYKSLAGASLTINFVEPSIVDGATTDLKLTNGPRYLHNLF